MGPLRLYEVFNAMKLHWSPGSYNFVKFKGKVKHLNRITLEQSPDRNVYIRVAKRYKIEKDFVMMLIPMFLDNPDIHISALLDKTKCDRLSTEWYRRIQTLPTTFANETYNIAKFIKESGMTYKQFFYAEPVLDFLMYDKITIESFIILDRILFFLTKGSFDSILYTQMFESKVQNYNTFVQVDCKRYKEIFEKQIIKAREAVM